MLFLKFSNRFKQGVFALVLMSVFFTVNHFAQSGSISGTVKDANDAVISGATVTATNKVSGSQMTTTTDQNGKYQFNNLSRGIYRVTASKSGFSDAGESVTVEGSVTQDFSMSLGSLREEVTVTATKSLIATSDIPQTVTVISEDEITQRRPVSVSEAIERSPSVLLTDTNPFRARPQIRGLQSNRILVTVDGERLNNPRFGADFVGVSTNLVDTSQVQSVEVIAGSGSSLFGSDAVGGTVNIITKGPQRERNGTRMDFRFDGDYGSNNNYRKVATNFGFSNNLIAVRVNLGAFKQPNFTLGDQSVSRNEVLVFGNFARAAGNLVGQAIVSAYPVYDITAGQIVPNSQARGIFGSVDMMLFASENTSARVRYSTNNYRDLGVPWTSTPYSTNRPNTGFSDFWKVRGVYEIREAASWLPRMQFSVYYQDYKRSLDEIRSGIVAGSSCVASFVPPPPAPQTPPSCTNNFSGNLSTFTVTGDGRTINRNTGKGFDAQFNFLPFKRLIYITGINFSNDFSRDIFASRTLSNGVVTSSVGDVRNTPNTVYENIGWYNQFDFNAHKYVRFSGGFRYDNWRTEARPTTGFPNGNIGTIFLRVLPLIQQSPGGLDAVGAAGYANLAAGIPVKSESNEVTYNIGATIFIPGGINPYIRYSTSFREPDLLARYLFRNFTTLPFFSLPSIVNTNLRPETGRDIDIGVKIARRKYRGTFAYFRNEIKDATGTVLNSYCIPFSPAQGILGTPGAFLPTPLPFGCTAPLPPPAPSTQHFVQVFQTVNFSTVLIRGFEVQAEADFQIWNFGSLTPFFTFSTIKATNKTPDPNRVRIVQNLYNANAPLELDGSPTDVPFYSLPNYQGTFAPRFTSANGRWWAEYEYRFTSRVTRVDPNEISFAGTTTYANFAAYKGLEKHSIRGGFRFGERFPVRVTMAVENLTDELYFQLFQPAPAMGRTFTIGFSFSLSELLK